MTPPDLLSHMIQYRMRDPKLKEGKSSEPSSYLNVDISDEQQAMLNPSASDLAMRSIMQDAGGDRAKHKLAKRKLEMYGSIKSHSGIANDPNI